jgi:transcription initiation factor TFIIE subunit alpha
MLLTWILLLLILLTWRCSLRDDDLAHLLGMQTKELHKLCGKLKEDRMIAVCVNQNSMAETNLWNNFSQTPYILFRPLNIVMLTNLLSATRPEMKEGQNRPLNRTYYFINFRETIDAIKYRAHGINKRVKETLAPTEERKDYICARCKSEYATMDVLPFVTPMGNFECKKCGNNLVKIDNTTIDSGGQEKLSRLMKQLGPILNLLQQIDEVWIDDNDFEKALQNQVPVYRDSLTNPQQNSTIIHTGPSTVQGLANAAPQLSINLTSNEEKTAAELAADQARKQALAAANALPVWHTQSTVTGDKSALGLKEEAAARERASLMSGLEKKEEDEKAVKENAEDDDAYNEYLTLMKQEKERAEKAEIDEEADEDDDDDEEDEFEDVGGLGTGDVGTPMSSSLGAPNSVTAKKFKTEESESGSSPATGLQTPAGEEGNAAKRVRIEEPVPEKKVEEDSEEEEEFEDV